MSRHHDLCCQVKTQLQAMAAKEIAVGYQHTHKGMADALTHIYTTCGVRGLWRGVSGAVSRVMVGSAAQLSTFSSVKQYIIKLQVRLALNDVLLSNELKFT